MSVVTASLTRVCSINGCSSAVLARGWCSAHYQRWRHHGDPLAGNPSPVVRKVVDHEDGTRTCTDCGQRKPLEQFNLDKNGTAGRRAHCMTCRSTRMKDWYEANQQRQVERARARMIRDAEKIRANDTLRYQRNRDARIELATEHGHRRRVRMAHTEVERGITVTALRKIHGDVCPYCEVTMTFLRSTGRQYIVEKATIEHRVALSKGGSHTFENTMLCCWRCNLQKNAKTLEEWHASVAATRERATEGVHSASA